MASVIIPVKSEGKKMPNPAQELREQVDSGEIDEDFIEDLKARAPMLSLRERVDLLFEIMNINVKFSFDRCARARRDRLA